MRCYQMIRSLKTILGIRKITVSTDNQKHDNAIIQLNDGMYQDFDARTSLLHTSSVRSLHAFASV